MSKLSCQETSRSAMWWGSDLPQLESVAFLDGDYVSEEKCYSYFKSLWSASLYKAEIMFGKHLFPFHPHPRDRHDKGERDQEKKEDCP